MATRKKRNHYIPRVILNRFASYRDKKRNVYKIWCYRIGGTAREISTKDAALGIHFYGKDDAELEDQFGRIESQIGGVLRDIDHGQSPSKFDEILSEFSWAQALRTRAFRDRFVLTASTALVEMSNAVDAPAARASLLKRMELQLEEKLKAVTPVELDYARVRLGGADPKAFLRSIINDAVDSGQLSSWFRKMLNELNDNTVLTDIGKEAHNRGLSQLFLKADLTPREFRASWRLLDNLESSLILGDSCLFGLRSDGSTHPICDAGSWAALVFPISPSKCLIGERDATKTGVDELDINRESAACSLEQFFASTDSGEYLELTSLIGSHQTMLSGDEISEVVRSVWDM